MVAEIKPIYGLNRVKLAEVIPLSAPFSVFVFPTTHCNFQCVYCGYSLGYKRMKERYDFNPETMSMELYVKIIDQLQEFPTKIKMLSLTGQGEPLINKNLPLMVEYAKKADIAERIEIITNASLLTPEMSKGLIDAGLDTLRISLQGLSSEKYLEICGKKINFEDFMENIRFFYRNKKTTNLFVKIMDVSLGEGEEDLFYQLFRDFSDRMYVEKMLPAYDGVELTQGMNVDYDRYGRPHTERSVCPLPFYMLGIFPNGDVEPCDTLYKPIVLGNVNEKHLLAMWNSKELHDFWLMQLEKQREQNPRCASCCAPNDVSHPEDILDDEAEKLISVVKTIFAEG